MSEAVTKQTGTDVDRMKIVPTIGIFVACGIFVSGNNYNNGKKGRLKSMFTFGVNLSLD